MTPLSISSLSRSWILAALMLATAFPMSACNVASLPSGAICGDDFCSLSESAESCVQDCGPLCGDGTCTSSETVESCGVDCGSSCGDGTCAEGEDVVSCARDCAGTCGDETCHGTEDSSSCVDDCGSRCGDELCNGDESSASCERDCGVECGDGACAASETQAGCPLDCPIECGDGACASTESNESCARDCPAACEDGACNGDESSMDCPADCGALCSDGVCNGDESSSRCPADCGAECGDGACNGTENASTCLDDCGSRCDDGFCTGTEDSLRCPRDCGGVEILSTVSSIAPFGGTYPRAIALHDGSILMTYDSADSSNFVLRTVIQSSRDTETQPWGTVAAESLSDPGRTLGNAFPHQLPSGRLLTAFRHHDRASGTQVYRLLLSSSDDGGQSWQFLSEIEVNTENGIWEPFLFNAPDGTLQVYYARELVNNDQDIVMRRSMDGGMTFGPRITVASQSGSRDGMPATVALSDGSLVTIFESFRSAGSGTFVIRTVQSTDNGMTWRTRQDVYVPASSTRNAGAPHLIVLEDGRLLASFMNDEGAPVTDWPNHAFVDVLLSAASPSASSLSWESTPTRLTEEGAFWPSLLRTPEGEVWVLYDRETIGLTSLAIH